MTCSKIFSGDLPELTYEIIKYFQNDFSTLYSCILVNRLWCHLAIPLLWEDTFSIEEPKNYHFIEIYLQYLEENDKEKLQDYGINKNLFPLNNTLFNYPGFIKHLNTWDIISTIKMWVTAIRNLSTGEIRNQSNQSDLLKFIYKSLFKIFIERETNLNTFDIFIFSNDDCDYFNIAFKLILQNQSFIHNIKILNFSIYPLCINIITIIPYLKSINTIPSLNYDFYGYCYDHNFNKIYLSQSFNSQNLNYLFTSIKNSNISNTLKIITFRNISFNNISVFNELYEQLNVLESIHIIDCNSLNPFIKQILNITKPFKLKTLFMKKELPNIDLLQLLLQKSGNYLENVSFGSLIKNESKRQSLELIIRYCMKIKVFELFGFDNQNIYLLFNLIENIGQNLDHLSIHHSSNSNIENSSLIVLQNLGQILPFKLEYLDLNLMIENTSDFEIFLKNSQNTFINRLCIKIMIREGDDILLYVKEYIMKKKRVKYLVFKVNNNDLFSLKDEVKEFELYNIKVQSYYSSTSSSLLFKRPDNVKTGL
uniref:F-box domain-containing protein n=1 Tax=Rhizophagus irregularis (strain DAOM 181602 / DAOM 197198 / MUCL 43194) TaxID=747089 RepID=U9SX95_RHIID